MFDWLKKWRDHKRAQLLYQNNEAASCDLIVLHFQNNGDRPVLERLGEIRNETNRIAAIAEATGLVSEFDADALLDINHELRVFFEEARKAEKAQTARFANDDRDFDETFQPDTGWSEYFKDAPVGNA